MGARGDDIGDEPGLVATHPFDEPGVEAVVD
jgi:hypothetical protein